MADKKVNIRVNMQGARQAQNQMRGLGDVTKKVSAIFSTVFASAALATAINLGKTAAAAEGVENAFKQINNPALLGELRKATRGTVSDLELMKAAVRARNFNIPLTELAKLLKFAQVRARQTGDDVNYMTESIILGVARKSIPILDNLGISAVQLREEMAKTGGNVARAVGNIADKTLEAGEAAETTADKYDRLGATFDNISVNIGHVINQIGSLIDTGLTSLLNFSPQFAKLLDLQSANADATKVLSTEMQEYVKNVLQLNDAQKITLSQLTTLEEKMAFAEKIADQARSAKEAALAYEQWRSAKIAKIEQDKQEALWTAVLLSQLGMITGKLNENVEPLKVVADTWAETGKNIEDVNASLIENQGRLADVSEEGNALVANLVSVADTFSNALGQAFQKGAIEGKNFLKAMETAFVSTLQRMVIELAARAAIFTIFNALSGGTFGATVGGLSNFAFRAAGGPVDRNKPYIVGEQGPELFVPNTPGKIVSNQDMSTRTVTVNISGNILSTDFVDTTVIPRLEKVARGLA